MDAPLNIDELDLADLVAESGEAAWKGGYFAYGTHGADKSTVIYFAIPPGKRLGKHVDTAEETLTFSLPRELRPPRPAASR